MNIYFALFFGAVDTSYFQMRLIKEAMRKMLDALGQELRPATDTKHQIQTTDNVINWRPGNRTQQLFNVTPLIRVKNT